MKEYRFLVQGSAADPYEVHFVQKEAGNLSAYCTCLAGTNRMYCKHRFNILSGISKGVVSSNIGDIAIVQTWLAGTDIDQAMNEVLALEKDVESIKKRLSKAKKALARAMHD